MSRFIEWLKSLFRKPVSNPVPVVSVPQEEQQWKPMPSPVGPATNPVPNLGTNVPISGTPVHVPPASTNNGQPTITDLLFRPNAEVGAILDSRITNNGVSTNVETPVSSVPRGFIQPIRLRCLLQGGIVYRSALNGFGLVISPTANDPAGQSAMYSAREVDANGNLIFDYGRVYKTMIVNKGSGIVEVSSDTTSEVWYEVRG